MNQSVADAFSLNRSSGRSGLWVWVVLGAIAMLGLWLRVSAVLHSEVIAPLRADAGQYVTYAYNLRHHGVYSRDTAGFNNPQANPKPDAFRSPGYPIFLIPFVGASVTYTSVVNIRMGQALLSGIVVIALFFIARFFLPATPSLLLALVTAVSPHLINANIYVLTEALFSAMLVLLFWFATLFDRNRVVPLFLIGLVIGAASLVRPSLQYFIVPMGFLVFLDLRGTRWVSAVAILLLGFALVYGPWLVRNQLDFGYLTDNKLKIATLHHGSYPNFMYKGRPETLGYPYRFDPNSVKIASSMDSVLSELRRRFTEEPMRHLKWFLLGKPVMFWSWDIVQGQGDAFVYPVAHTPYNDSQIFKVTHALMKGLHWPLVILGLIGAFLAWLPAATLGLDRNQLFIARMGSLVLFYFTALHMVAAPFPRYSVPLRPILYLMAVAAGAWLFRMFRTTNNSSSAVNS